MNNKGDDIVVSLDSKKIEILAVNAVKDSIVTTDFLDQYIAENDKEPSWDGFVYIYGDIRKTKDTLKGRMPVQVKGKECDDHSNKEISYSMSKADLVNYLNDSGIDSEHRVDGSTIYLTIQ